MRALNKEELAEWAKKHPASVVVLRGVSGAGKSTVARYLRDKHLPNAVICCADSFFIGADGVYRFKAIQLGKAHADCVLRAAEAIRARRPVIVDNTNTLAVEAAPYMALAQAYGSPVLLVTLPVLAGVAAPRNVHRTPDAVVLEQERRMKDDNKRLPVFWDCVQLVEG